MDKKGSRRNSYSQQLEDHGYTKNIRNRYKDHANFYEDGFQIMPRDMHLLQNYKFGSFIEATMLPGLKSDMDLVILLKRTVAFDRRIPCSHSMNRIGFEMIRDPWTSPGHVKLVPYENADCIDAFQFLSTKHDICGREVLCYSRNLFYTVYMDTYRNYQDGQRHLSRSGPAMTLSSRGGRNLDFIHAITCGNWPACANAWLRRRRTLLWLGRKEMQRLAGLSCFLVPTGYHESNLEWRISFSLQERELFWKLTDLQYKCFIMMKYIKEAFFGKILNNSENSLTSYHCKTALYYTIENNPGIWTKEDLITVTTACFRLLLKWSSVRYCPSYFVPTVNLFSKLTENELGNMTSILQAILTMPILHFSKGLELMINMHNSEPKFEILHTETPFRSIRFLESLDHTHRELGSILGCVMEYVSHLSLDETVCYLSRLLNMKLEGANLLISLALPFFHTTLACHLVVKAVDSVYNYTRDCYFMISAFHFWKGLNSDTMSSKLKLVTVLLYTGHKDSAVALLKEISLVNTSFLFFGCSCFYSAMCNDKRFLHFHRYKRAMKGLESLSTDELIRRHLSHCVMFLPSEIKITPYPFRFEMFRTYAVPHDAQGPALIGFWWFRCAVIDSETYMHFLLHLTDLSWMESGEVSQKLFENTTEHTWDHYHMETKLNVAGWLTEKSGYIAKALEMYLASWRHFKTMQWQYTVLPDNKLLFHTNNAVKWHIVLLVYRMWCDRQKRGIP